MLTIGQTFAGYRIEALVGAGGMGVVYEATQLALERHVALKIVSPAAAADPVFRERFRREGVVQARLDHPHVVTVYEAGEAEGQLFLAMRLITGPTLKALLRTEDVDHQRAARLLGQVASALDAAHEAGLVHRDVKPQNVIVAPGDHAYLVDFGLTWAPGSTRFTASDRVSGTAEYVAPEIISGESPTVASDVYAFAVTAFECLTGSLPYERETSAALLWAHVHEPIPRASEQRPELSSAVDDALARGMAKDPAARPATAGALATELEHAFGIGEPPTATGAIAPPRARRARRPSRRIAAAAVGAGAVAAAVLVVALGGGGDGEPAATPSTDPRGAVTLGSNLKSAADVLTCTGDVGASQGCTTMQTALPRATLHAPFDGVVTSWRLRGAKGSLALVVLRGEGRLRVVAMSASVHPSGRGVQQFATRIPIRKGDRLALEVAPGSSHGAAYARGARSVRYLPSIDTPGRERLAGPPDTEILMGARVERRD